MLLVSRFNRAHNVDRGNIRAGKRAIVHDLFDARTGRSDLRGEIGKPAGTVADHRGEPAETAIGHQTALDHATEDIWINIPARKNERHAFALELLQFTG